MSLLWRSTKITKTTMMPAVASGWTNGPITCALSQTKLTGVLRSGPTRVWGLFRIVNRRQRDTFFAFGTSGNFIAQFLQHFRGSSNQTIRAADEFDRLDLFLEIALVAGNLLGKLDELTCNQKPKSGNHNERHGNCANHCRCSRHVQALEPCNDRRQHETEKYRHGQRHQYVAAEVQSGNRNANRDSCW